ncbi:MAG: hypothetical protein ACQEVA_11435, partial [Myxococcota bacterium]
RIISLRRSRGEAAVRRQGTSVWFLNHCPSRLPDSSIVSLARSAGLLGCVLIQHVDFGLGEGAVSVAAESFGMQKGGDRV